jgi:uncharacterized protein YndB with AHSA1/START domain
MRNVIRVVLIVVALLILFIGTRPGEFHVERSTTIAAPAAAVYSRLDDFHQWAAWSPWDKFDPQMSKVYEGAASGVGASYHWTGNNKVGEGRMTISQSEPPARLVMTVEFFKPWKGNNTTTFSLAPDGANTKLTWAMEGKEDFMGKAMGLFMNMDKMIGPDFERGLANLRTQVEGEAPHAEGGAAAAPPAGK